MAGQSMEIDTAHLHAGAERCDDAAQTALTAAGKLAEMAPGDGVFGDFAEAQAFHELVSAARQSHIEQLHGHHRALTDIGDQSRSGAERFTTHDTSTADSLRTSESHFDGP